MTGAREGRRGGAQIVRSMIEAGDIGILVRRHVTPRWADDTERGHFGGGGVGAGGGCPPPRKEISKREER